MGSAEHIEDSASSSEVENPSPGGHPADIVPAQPTSSEIPTASHLTPASSADDSAKRLLAQATAGDTEAFGLLVDLFRDRLVHSLTHALGSREDALDAAQTGFLQAWENLGSFRGDSSFYSWLYRIAWNAAAAERRRAAYRRRPVSLETSVAGSLAGSTPPPEQGELRREEIAIVRQALDAVDATYRSAVVLREIDGLSYEEISEILGVPVGTVRSRIFRARKELCEILGRLLPGFPD